MISRIIKVKEGVISRRPEAVTLTETSIILDITKIESNNARFSVDVISLCKFGFRHVGAHERCEIVCNSMAFLSAHDRNLQIIHLSNGYFPRKRYKITR